MEKKIKLTKHGIDKWNCWKYDIYENNKSTWTTYDDKVISIIDKLISTKERK